MSRYLYYTLWSCSVVSDSCDPMDCSLPGSSVQGIFQASVLEWGAITILHYICQMTFISLLWYHFEEECLERHRTQHPVTSTIQFLLGLEKTHQFIERSGKPGVQQFLGSQRGRHDWATEPPPPPPSVYTSELSCLLNSN